MATVAASHSGIPTILSDSAKDFFALLRDDRASYVKLAVLLAFIAVYQSYVPQRTGNAGLALGNVLVGVTRWVALTAMAGIAATHTLKEYTGRDLQQSEAVRKYIAIMFCVSLYIAIPTVAFVFMSYFLSRPHSPHTSIIARYGAIAIVFVASAVLGPAASIRLLADGFLDPIRTSWYLTRRFWWKSFSLAAVLLGSGSILFLASARLGLYFTKPIPALLGVTVHIVLSLYFARVYMQFSRELLRSPTP